MSLTLTARELMTMHEPDVEIVTVTYNSAKHLPAFVEGLESLNYPPEKLRLIVVDNASRDDTRGLLRELLPRLPFRAEVIESASNDGFGAACNRAVASGSAPFALFLNPDTRVISDMLRLLVGRVVGEPDIGLIDAAQYPVTLPKWRDPVSDNTDWCSGAAVLARREAFVQIGGFDTFFFLYGEDVDLSWRMWLAGWRCVYETRAGVHHYTVPDGGGPNPVETRYTIRYSFAMRVIYDTPRGALGHLIRGVRYLLSPRTSRLTRRAVAEGLWTTARRLRYLLGRRRSTQSALRASCERERFVFTEWYYGRWVK